MDKTNSVAIVGGTHGNEYSGIYLLRKWQATPSLIQREHLSVTTLLANANAYRDNKRYVDCDLNRQFTTAKLSNADLNNYEESRAKVINSILGPKGSATTQVDFVIDLHNTTSNMGPSLILLQSDSFNLNLAAYVKQHMAKAVIIMEDQTPMHEQPYLCSIAPQGIIIEVGPQPQSVIRQDVMEWMETLTHHVLDFISQFNSGSFVRASSTVEVYAYSGKLKLPVNDAGERIGMVHKNIQDRDFKALNPGDPVFTLFDGGTELPWDGDYTAYPHFINEAAYYDNNLAMSLAKKVVYDVPTAPDR